MPLGVVRLCGRNLYDSSSFDQARNDFLEDHIHSESIVACVGLAWTIDRFESILQHRRMYPSTHLVCLFQAPEPCKSIIQIAKNFLNEKRKIEKFSKRWIFLRIGFWVVDNKFSPFFSGVARPIGLKIFRRFFETMGVRFSYCFEKFRPDKIWHLVLNPNAVRKINFWRSLLYFRSAVSRIEYFSNNKSRTPIGSLYLQKEFQADRPNRFGKQGEGLHVIFHHRVSENY